VEIKLIVTRNFLFQLFDFSKNPQRNLAESVLSTDFLDPDPSHKFGLCIFPDCTKLW